MDCIYYYYSNVSFAANVNNVSRGTASRHIASLSMLPDTYQMLYKTCRYTL